MRSLPRRLRAFRPLTDALEGRAAASDLGLLSGITASASRFSVGTEKGALLIDAADRAASNSQPAVTAQAVRMVPAGAATPVPSRRPAALASYTASPSPALPAQPASPRAYAGALLPETLAKPTDPLTLLSPPIPVLKQTGAGVAGSVPAPDTAPSNGIKGTIRPLSLAPPVSQANAMPVVGSATSGRTASTGTSGFASTAMATPTGCGGGGGLTNVVGGHQFETIYTTLKCTNITVTNVVWQVDGGMMPAGSNPPAQTYTPTLGDFQRLPNPYTQPINKPSGSSVNFDFYWNEEARMHTIYYKINYSDGSSEKNSQPISVNVMKPTVNSFQDVYQPLTFGPFTLQNQYYDYGLHQGAENPYGDVFSASVNTVGLPVGGYFAFQEMVNFTYTVTDGAGQHTRSGGTADAQILDNPPGVQPGTPDYATVFVNGYVTPPINAGLASAAIPVSGDTNPNLKQGMVVDSPYLGHVPSTGGAGGTLGYAPWTDLSMNFHANLYLVYASPDGLWVALSQLALPDLVASKHWNGNAWTDTQPGTDPPLPGNPPSPATGGTVSNRTDATKFLKWSTDFTSCQMTPPLQLG